MNIRLLPDYYKVYLYFNLPVSVAVVENTVMLLEVALQ